MSYIPYVQAAYYGLKHGSSAIRHGKRMYDGLRCMWRGGKNCWKSSSSKIVSRRHKYSRRSLKRSSQRRSRRAYSRRHRSGYRGRKSYKKSYRRFKKRFNLGGKKLTRFVKPSKVRKLFEQDGIPIPPGVKTSSVTDMEKFKSKYFIGHKHLKANEILFFPVNGYQYKPKNMEIKSVVYEGIHRLDIYMFNIKPFVRIIDQTGKPQFVLYPFATVIAWNANDRSYAPIEIGNDIETYSFGDQNYGNYKYYMVDNIKIRVKLHHRTRNHSFGIIDNDFGTLSNTYNQSHGSYKPYMTTTIMPIKWGRLNNGNVSSPSEIAIASTFYNDPMAIRGIDKAVVNNNIWWDLEKVMHLQGVTLQRHIPSSLNLNIMLKPDKFKAVVDAGKDENLFITKEMSNGFYTGYTNQIDNNGFTEQKRFVRTDTDQYHYYMTHYSINNIPSSLMLNSNMKYDLPVPWPNFENNWYQYNPLEDGLAAVTNIPSVNKDLDPVVTIEYSYRVRFWGNLKSFEQPLPEGVNRFMELNETLSAPVSPRDVTDSVSLEDGYASMPDDYIDPEVVQEDVYDEDDILELPSLNNLQEKE